MINNIDIGCPVLKDQYDAAGETSPSKAPDKKETLFRLTNIEKTLKTYMRNPWSLT